MPPTQMNFGPKQSYKTAENAATVDHAQVNFSGSGTTKKGGGSAGRQVNFSGKQGVPGPKTVAPKFGSKPGTGQRGGY